MPRPAKPFDLVLFFAALADVTRLRLLNLMNGREVCVCYFVEVLRLPQPKISRHLAYLRRAAIVTARREGKWMHYSIQPPNNPEGAAVLATTLNSISHRREMQTDLAKLTRACCNPDQFVTLQGAPAPAKTSAR